MALFLPFPGVALVFGGIVVAGCAAAFLIGVFRNAAIGAKDEGEQIDLE